jgi:hypothetical protein
VSASLIRQAGRTTARALRAIRRRPRASSLLLVPLAFLAILAPDLFMAVPWPVRRSLGMLAFGSMIGLGVARLMWVRRSDRWPATNETRPPTGPADRILPWALAAATASLSWPMLARPGIGHGDWDFYLQTYEAVRKTVLEHGQFPWWNPWSRGGFPLAADPQCSLVPIASPLALLLGAGAGARLAAVLCLMIAVEGARRLARDWLGDPWASCAAGLVFGLHGGMIVYTVAGLYVTMSFCALPWLLHHACRLADRPGQGVALGLWAGFVALSGISYPSIYALLIVSAVGLRGLRVERGARRWRYLRHGVLAVGLMLALTGWRLGPMVKLLGDFPRSGGMMIDLRLAAYVEQMLHRPSIEELRTVTAPIFWESNCAIGVIGVGLLAASLVRGWRWWHWLAVIAFAMGLGAGRWHQPSFWASYLPVFKTMHVVTRWRVAAMLGVGLAAGDGVAWLRSSRLRWPRAIGAILVVVLGADLVAFGHRALPVALGPSPTEDRLPSPPVDRPVNLEHGPSFPNTLRGYGTIRSIQPILGYNTNAPTARLWPGHPDYLGEAWTADGPVSPDSWSPNRITFRVEPDQEIQINQNPGSWWLVNGDRPFAGLRCVEWDRPFVARADDRGLLELRIAPIGLGLGLALHAAGILLILGAITTGTSFQYWNRVERPGRVS